MSRPKRPTCCEYAVNASDTIDGPPDLRWDTEDGWLLGNEERFRVRFCPWCGAAMPEPTP